jgi:tetratricopeptide (TPR) repeat protein
MARGSWMMMLGVLGAALLNGCTSAPRPIEEIRASGEHRYKYADFDGARDEFAEIVSRYPGDWQAQYMLGQSMLKTGDLSAARRALETAYTHKPESQEVADALAEVLFQQKDEARLFAFLRDRAAKTQSVSAHLALAKYAGELNDPDSARTAVDTAIQLDDGKHTEPYLEAAQLAERLGQMDEAVRRLRQAYGVNPVDRRVQERLVALGETMGDLTPLPPGR